MRILLLSRYTNAGASSRYRSYQYLPYLRDHGFEVTIAPLLRDLYIERLYARKSIPIFDVIRSYARRVALLLHSQRYDLIWLEYEAFPWTPYWIESLLFKTNVPYMVDYDDAVFHRYDQHTSNGVRWVLGKKIDRVMRGATLVTVGNEYLAKRACDAKALRVEIVPTVVDLNRYPLMPLPKNQNFTIGWIGSPITSHYLKGIEGALRTICQDGTARMVIVGETLFELDGVPVEMRTWSVETEVQEVFKFDVGIMPLVDSPWERGKCGHKLIQYMACGRPVVASPVGVNQKIVEHGVNGFLASDTNEWIKALTILRDNPALREEMGKAGRKKVETQYCTNVTAPRLASLLNEVMRRSS